MERDTVQFTEAIRQLLGELSARTGESRQAILEAALERYRRELLLEGANRAYAALWSDSGAWREELEERALWERSLADGLAEA